MSATDDFRAMLDERGVKWTAPNSILRDMVTCWTAGGFDYEAFEVPEPDGTFLLTAAHQDDLTPEQAIEATLGRGTCQEVKIDRYWRGCGECGYVWEFMYGIGKCERPRYCPNCGRKVRA